MAYFGIFKKLWLFRFVMVCFKTVCSVVSVLYRNREFRLNRNKQKTNQNSLIESIFRYFSENLGLFRLASKQFCLFQLFRYRFEIPKQTEIFFFGFTKQTKTQPKQILFQFVLVWTKSFFCLFRGHRISDNSLISFLFKWRWCSLVWPNLF